MTTERNESEKVTFDFDPANPDGVHPPDPKHLALLFSRSAEQ
jgi:hypothetical protein